MSSNDSIIIIGAAEHNLRNVDVTIPRDSLTVITGLSGSGKSSLAFDTIYAEGQRRYMESLSAYARQYLDQLQKPKVEYVEGLSPAISIEQKTVSKNPRSTVGTVTEIYDYLRVLYANVGKPHCPNCDIPITRQSPTQIADTIMAHPEGTRIMVMAPVVRGRKGVYRQLFDEARRAGYVRALVNGKIVDLDNPPDLKKTHKHSISLVIDRLVIGPEIRSRLDDAVQLALAKADGLMEVQNMADDSVRLYSEHFSCPECGSSVAEITPRLFSFNSPYGACSSCNGLGYYLTLDADRLISDPGLSIENGALAIAPNPLAKRGSRFVDPDRAYPLLGLQEVFGIRLDKPFGKLSKDHQEMVLNGNGDLKMMLDSSITGRPSGRRVGVTWEGLIPEAERRFEEDDPQVMHFYRPSPCDACNGARLNQSALAVRLNGLHIGQFSKMSIEAAAKFMADLPLTERETLLGGQIVREVRERLEFLHNVGLQYLTLDRQAGTLSGGEAQRIRLATQIGSQLTGVLYVLDEPSIGLHQRDNERLIHALLHLRDLGNTLIVVEHDESTMKAADFIVDMGPGAGTLGGEIVFQGTAEQMLADRKSVTGDYLRGTRCIEIPEKRRPVDKARALIVRGAREHNLRRVDALFPLGVLTVVAGVSGSGKSTLVNDILYSALANHVYHSGRPVGAYDRIENLELVDKVVEVDQSPIGRTPRSNPATYTQVFTAIRDLYAQLPESQIRGYAPGRFSFNVKGGRCDECSGDGMKRIEMHFLPDTYVECQVCHGRRFNRETLEVVYKGKSIADVLDMTIDDATEFFSAQPAICHKITTLRDVGLGYLTLGQSSTTLSGGEAQRIKLAKELSKRATGKTVYILDEPTTGLHFEDIRKLLEVLQALVERGNTVIVIEHNLDVIKSADHIIDMGPDGGEHGGMIVAEGTPEEVAANAKSATGRFIAPVLQCAPQSASGAGLVKLEDLAKPKKAKSPGKRKRSPGE